MWKFLGEYYDGFDIKKINVGDYWVMHKNIWRVVDIKDDEITVMPDHVINIKGTCEQIDKHFLNYVRNYIKHDVFKSNDVKYVGLPTYDDLFDPKCKFDILKAKKWDPTFVMADQSYWLKYDNGFIFIDIKGCARPLTRMEAEKICDIKPKIILECNKTEESLIKKLENVVAELKDICNKLKEGENNNG